MNRPWWQRTSVYQIYPRSFYDSDGDGIGDLPGIIARLDYLRDLGVETLWLCPFWKSPQRDFGYDISDHYAVAPEYGTLEDCLHLLEGAHARGMRVILDMVLNHTSDEHPWFMESRRSKQDPRRDFYIWRRGKRPGGAAPPNNWRSIIGPRGWHYDRATDEWYFASFLPFQPDLNYRNPAVQDAMLNVVRHWLSQGFDGLRLDIFNCLFKDPSFANNPPSWRPLPGEDCPDGFFQRYLYTVNHQDTYAFARTLRRVVDEIEARDQRPRFLVGEVFGSPEILRRYCQDESGAGLHLVFLFKSLRTPSTAVAFHKLIAEFEREFPAPLLPTYVFGNHDRPRSSGRFDADPAHVEGQAKLLATLQLTVRGVPFIYYGEEIGQKNLDLSMRTAKDPLAQGFRFLPDFAAHWLRRRGILLNRDECRGPMQWSDAPNAGFTIPQAQPWLPVHDSFLTQSVTAAQKNSDSLLNTYRRLLALRREQPALHSGSLILHEVRSDAKNVLSYRRTDGMDEIEVLLNFGRTEEVVSIPTGALLFSTHASSGNPREERCFLRPYQAIIVKLERSS